MQATLVIWGITWKDGTWEKLTEGGQPRTMEKRGCDPHRSDSRELSLLHERWKEGDGVEEEVSLVGREATM
jgi:hypothetical protein